MKTFIDLKGQKFGRLTVLSFSHINSYNEPIWHCLCQCGKKVDRNGRTMMRGKARSCGCLRVEEKRKFASKAFKTHGQSRTRTYRSWASMIDRCTNPISPKYSKYIKMCKSWDKFENFHEDMGDMPQGYNLMRINNKKGYNKYNCKWATTIERNSNRKDNVLLTRNGETKTQSAWAREMGVSKVTIHFRLKNGWSIEDALSTPSAKNNINQ